MATEKNKPFKDEQTEKRVHEHLRNENDIISDEDISNAKTFIDEERSGELTNEEEKPLEKEQDVANDNTKKDEVEDARIETSWNILNK